LRRGRDPRGDVDCQAGEIVADEFALAGVNASPNLEAELVRLVPNLARAPDRARGTVEARKETVTRLLYLAATETLKLRTGQRVVALAQLTPSHVPQLSGAPGGIDDICEQDGGQHPVRRPTRTGAGEEFLDLASDRFRVAGAR
jgi:hypothetical protein